MSQKPEMRQIEGNGEENVEMTAVGGPRTTSELQDVESDHHGRTDARKLALDHPPKPLQKDNRITPKPSHPQAKEMVDQATYQQLRRECRELKRDLDDTAHDLRKSDRENKDQSRELRDLKKENAELLETLRSRLEAGAKHKEETDRLYEHMDIMENNIMHLRQELHKRRNLMESLTLQTREANEDKADAELTARKLMKQNRDLNENLTECKDDLLRLQPPTQISDSELAEQYSNLHQQISRWVDDETEDSQQMEQRFEDFSTTNEEPSELLRKYLGSEHFRLGKKHPSSQPLILRYIIQSHLDQYIFRDDIHIFGLSPQYTTLLRGIEQGMRMLEPQRDAITISLWRSETLRGLCKMSDFKEEQCKQAMAISQSLYAALSYLIPSIDAQKDVLGVILDQIINPAIQVATNMRLSTATYRTTSRVANKNPELMSIMYAHELQRVNMMDLFSHKIIRPDSALKVAEDGRIGEQILVVQPALMRRQKDGGGSVVLCKPTMLVKLDEPMGKRNKGFRAISSWLTGDGE